MAYAKRQKAKKRRRLEGGGVGGSGDGSGDEGRTEGGGDKRGAVTVSGVPPPVPSFMEPFAARRVGGLAVAPWAAAAAAPASASLGPAAQFEAVHVAPPPGHAPKPAHAIYSAGGADDAPPLAMPIAASIGFSW